MKSSGCPSRCALAWDISVSKWASDILAFRPHQIFPVEVGFVHQELVLGTPAGMGSGHRGERAAIGELAFVASNGVLDQGGRPQVGVDLPGRDSLGGKVGGFGLQGLGWHRIKMEPGKLWSQRRSSTRGVLKQDPRIGLFPEAPGVVPCTPSKPLRSPLDIVARVRHQIVDFQGSTAAELRAESRYGSLT